MHKRKLREVIIDEDGNLPGVPELTQCWSVGPGHWTQEVAAIYSLASDGEVNENTVPYHVHFEMTKEQVRSNWERIPQRGKDKIRQCTTVSFNTEA